MRKDQPQIFTDVEKGQNISSLSAEMNFWHGEKIKDYPRIYTNGHEREKEVGKRSLLAR